MDYSRNISEKLLLKYLQWDSQGWQSIDCPGKPGWQNLGFPWLGNAPKIGSARQYWVFRFFPNVFIMKNIKSVCIIVLFLNLRVLLVLEYIVESCSGGANDIRFLHTRQGFPRFSPVLDISVLYQGNISSALRWLIQDQWSSGFLWYKP